MRTVLYFIPLVIIVIGKLIIAKMDRDIADLEKELAEDLYR